MPRNPTPVAQRGSLFRRSQETPESPEDTAPAAVPVETEPERIKRSYFLPPETVRDLEDLQYREYRATGEKPQLSDLVREAIGLLVAERRRST